MSLYNYICQDCGYRQTATFPISFGVCPIDNGKMIPNNTKTEIEVEDTINEEEGGEET